MIGEDERHGSGLLYIQADDKRHGHDGQAHTWGL